MHRLVEIMRFVLIFIFVAAVSISAGVTVRTASDGKTGTVPSFEDGGVVWVSVADLALRAGFRASGQGGSNQVVRLTLSNDRGRISFIANNHFYGVDTAFFVLPHAPALRGETLYLPASLLVGIFGARHPGVIDWDAKASVITISEQKPAPPVSPPPAAGAQKPAASVSPSAAASAQKPVASVSPPAAASAQKPVSPALPGAADVSWIRTVVIDPGHGGRDPGAVGPTGVMEKDVVLGIGLELKKLLEKAGLKVHMTRERDVFVPLRDRTKFANDKRADIFVSIHTDAVGGDQKRRDAVKGYKVYFLSDAKNEEDKMVAMRENAVIEFEDKDLRQDYASLSDVLNSLAGAEFLRESQELSITIEQALGAGVKGIPRLHRGVGQANFWVLNGALMPSVLVEVGFISNSAEEKLLSDKRVQAQQAAAISRAVLQFKKQIEMGF